METNDQSESLGPCPAREKVLFGVAVLVLAMGAEGASARRQPRDGQGVDLALSMPRDPVEFLSDLTDVMPPPAVVLNRQDAVARELLMHSTTLTEMQALRTARALGAAAEELGYDPLLFLAVIHVESFYNHLAISPVGAEGLMQLMPMTARETADRFDLRWRVGDSFDPVLNVRLGALYLVDLHRRFRRMDHALTAYNRGPRNTWAILRTHGALPSAVNAFYARKVLGRYEILRRRYAHLPAGEV